MQPLFKHPSHKNTKLACFSLLLSVFLAIFLASCAGTPIQEDDPKTLFQEAEEEVGSNHYQIAIDKFRVIKNKFPYSKYGIDAELRIADVYFLEESFPEAAMSYESFEELHPKHEKVAYAMFRTGKSYFNDMPTEVARDLSSAQKALEAYRNFLIKFPKDTHTTEAETDIEAIRNLLAKKELYVGDFYFKRKHFAAAAERYRRAVDLYPGTLAEKEAKARLAKAEEKEESH